MKKLFLITILLFTTTTTFSQIYLDQNGLKTSVVNSLSAASTQAKRYEIAAIGYNSHHWQSGGSIVVELYQQYYSTGYEKYVIENGFRQGTDTSLPIIKLVESNGQSHNAKLSLGSPFDLTTYFFDYINKALPIILDVKDYSQYKVKITYLQDKVDVLTGQNQIKINQTPKGTDIPDFAVSTELSNNLITSGNLRISGAGNHYIQNGNVGIGTTNPTSKLTVKGEIHSREVKVTVDAGADFVFAEDYALPSLDAVDKYIKENKHLPEIASAAEMQTNGINLSEMNIKLLQKLEELTLYTIEQEKKNTIQSKEIEILKRENEAFKSLSERLSKLENQYKQ
jgi:hypothetical protein